MPQVSAVGISWYREEDYERLMELFEDAEDLPASYGQWLRAANQAIEQLKGKGHIAVKAYITPDEFIAWCSARGLRLDAGARQAFASEFAFKYLNDPRNRH